MDNPQICPSPFLPKYATENRTWGCGLVSRMVVLCKFSCYYAFSCSFNTLLSLFIQNIYWVPTLWHELSETGRRKNIKLTNISYLKSFTFLRLHLESPHGLFKSRDKNQECGLDAGTERKLLFFTTDNIKKQFS